MTGRSEGELAALTRERPLVTPERHASNDYYGNAAVLKRYAGLRPRRSLAAVVEHGIVLTDFVWDVDLASGMPLLLCAGAPRAAELSGLVPDGMRVAAIGPLVRYVDAPVPPLPPAREGMLVAFPAHSTHHIDTSYDAEAFAELLVTQRARYRDVVVCLYWRDVQRGMDAPYRRRGLPCTSAGHIYDRGFLARLHGILAGASAVVTNEPGSVVIHAASLDRPVWIVEQAIDWTAPDDVQERDGRPNPLHATQQALRAHFGEPTDALNADQRELIDTLGGTSQVRSRAGLRTLLLEAARTDAARTGTGARLRRDATHLLRTASVVTRATAGRFLD